MIIDTLKEKIKGRGIRIVFTEGWDARVQEAATKLAAEDVIRPVLLGEKEEIEATAKENGFDLTGIETMNIPILTKWLSRWLNSVEASWISSVAARP